MHIDDECESEIYGEQHSSTATTFKFKSQFKPHFRLKHFDHDRFELWSLEKLTKKAENFYFLSQNFKVKIFLFSVDESKP